jgi:hypothetical protein
MLRVWRRRVLKSLLRYLASAFGPNYLLHANAHRDLEVGRDCLVKAAGASWFEWSMGSTPFFWRWSEDSRALIRDGHPPWMKGPLPHSVKPQRSERNPAVQHMIHNKLRNVHDKGYIGAGDVLNLTSYFAVPKGDSDIRMVYDASASGLNKCLWAPTFALPSSDTLLDLLTPESWMSDMDMGEQFLNFHLHEALQPYCGIDVRPFFDCTHTNTMWLRWSRCMMGLRISPYVAIKSTYLGEEIVQGNPGDNLNPLHWEKVCFNLPGSPQYTPSLPWVRRTTHTGEIASSVPRYVDDMRPVGSSAEACWDAMHQSATYFSYLGIQITGRKTRPPSQVPGPWAGTLAFASPDGIGVACLPEKWLKAQRYIDELQLELQEHASMDHKQLERIRGFLSTYSVPIQSCPPSSRGCI